VAETWSCGSEKHKFHPCVCCRTCHVKVGMVEVVLGQPTDEMAALSLLLCTSCAGKKLEILLEDIPEEYGEEFLRRSI
jgi:hypothetical protein